MSPTDMNPTPAKVEDCSCFAIRKAARQAARLYDAYLQPTGLRISQFLILTLLEEIKSAPVNDLAERLDTERTAMGKMVAVLEREGLIRIAPSPSDGRVRLVEPTEHGVQLMSKAFPLWLEAQHRLETLNGKQNVATLRLTLSALDTRCAAPT